MYYYVVENVFNEFKKNGISIPFQQVEVRERTDGGKMPFNAAPLPERVEKQRPVEQSKLDELKKAYEDKKDKIGQRLEKHKQSKAKKDEE